MDFENFQHNRIVISHPTGNANVRGAVAGFEDAGILDSFHTCIACFKGTLLYQVGRGPLKELRRRAYDLNLQGYVHKYPMKEGGRILASKLGLKGCVAHETGRCCVDAVYHDLDRKVARYIRQNPTRISAVYAYEDGALDSFRAAKEEGRLCLYDLPIGYWRSMRSLLNEERLKNPEWAVTLGGFYDSERKLQRKDAELALADHIYVASSFTKKTLEAYPGTLADIEVIPYGFPPVNRERTYSPIEGRKLRVLFVGGLSQRKGLSYLFDAVKGMESQLELTVVGQGDLKGCKPLKEALNGIRYIPSLSHDEILNLMAYQDLFIFPSLFEGFGLVITEAMSQGTPVITTDRTCGPDVITDGKDGWIVKAGSAGPIRNLLEQFLSTPSLLTQAGKAARETAARRPWNRYGQELSDSINALIHHEISQS